MPDYGEAAKKVHARLKGKIAIVSKKKIKNREDLSILYTPGVAEPCREIAKDKSLVYRYTSRWNIVAVVSDGSAVLGLGNIGPEAGLPVMEGKAVLFKEFGGVDAFPICLATQDPAEIIRTVELLEPCLGGVNLEDISAPRCFQIEEALKKKLSIPVFHDDQHGTAIVTLAGLINALKIVPKNMESMKIVICGAGSAGIAITKILYGYGMKNIMLVDSKGIVSGSRNDLNQAKKDILSLTNKQNVSGSLKDALVGADVFIGVSGPKLLGSADIAFMAKDSFVFAMSNPDPEVHPDDAKKGGAAIIATGRSDFPNQINNVLAFPGIFRGALDCMATAINEEMKLAAANAIASLVTPAQLKKGMIIPSPLDRRVGKAVAYATAKAAMKTGVARLTLSDAELAKKIGENLKG
ncbi:MAG: NADP-dependent malic enzyme [Spirochaetaceae bacterium]|nr:MAG: NADP-dependent malic enzyme [Spirochaetaceae bacterium]